MNNIQYPHYVSTKYNLVKVTTPIETDLWLSLVVWKQGKELSDCTGYC